MKTKTLLKFIKLSICFVCILSLSVPPRTVSAESEPLDSIYTDEVQLIVGELEQIRVYNLIRLSVTDPEIVDIVDADDEEILVVAKEVGQSALFLWDDHGKRTIMITIVGQDLEFMEKRVQTLIDRAGIQGTVVKRDDKGGKVVVSGQVPTEQKILYDRLVEPFLLEEEIIDLVEEERHDDLIQIDMQITELTQTLTESLGVEWSSTDDEILTLDWEETLPSFDGSFEDAFAVGDFSRVKALQTTINLFVEEGKGRILSKPKLVVKSGEEATFLVGGEIPVRTTATTTAGGLQENVEYKDYGIGMTITPKIVQGRVDILLNTEISEIDRANAVGDDVAFTTRTAQTHLMLDDRQTVIMAGLIKKSEGETITKVPVLGNIPIVGMLFRNKRKLTPDEDTEIVISLTPTLIAQQDMMHAKDTYAPMAGATGMMKPHLGVQPSHLSIPQEMTEYVKDIQRKISSAVIYPSEAEEYGWEGTVKVGLLILRDGTLAFALVKESSGYDIIDDYALNTAKNVAPYSSFPDNTDLQEINITVPIVYSLNN